MTDQIHSTSTANPQTILIVEDDPVVLRLCCTILEQASFQVLQASGSSDALKICTERTDPIHLLITDLVLIPPGFQLASESNQFPYVHGYELAARVVSMRKDTRVLLMSGNLDKELAGYGITRGSLPFLQKPFGLEAFTTMVRDVLAGPPAIFEDNKKKSGAGDIEWFG